MFFYSYVIFWLKYKLQNFENVAFLCFFATVLRADYSNANMARNAYVAKCCQINYNIKLFQFWNVVWVSEDNWPQKKKTVDNNEAVNLWKIRREHFVKERKSVFYQ